MPAAVLPAILRNSSLPMDVPKAINSAGEHHGSRKAIDIILLLVCLLVPVLIWGVIRTWESLSTAGQRKADTKQGRRAIPRIGSLYRLQERDTSSMSPVGSLMPATDIESAEGTKLQNILAGFSTAMAVLPDAISFSFICGNSPLNGIWAGVFMSIGTSLVGGRPGMVSSASAATAVVLAKVSAEHGGGMGPMALCVLIVGILQIMSGALKSSRFMTLIPHPVMLGFVNGLAIIMLRSQLRHFHEHGSGPWVNRHTMVSMLATAGVTMFVAMAWKRVPYMGKVVPAALASLIVAIIFSNLVQQVLPRRTLRDIAGPGIFRGGLSQVPAWDFPPKGVDWSDHGMFLKVLGVAIRFAIVGLLESLMTEALIDQITGTSGSMRRECFGQGMGNILASLFGTQGGCALIAQSLLNVSSGGRGRLSGVVVGVSLLLSVVVLAPLIGTIPVAAVIGLITLIALNTFAWGTFRLIMRINWIDSAVVVLVTLVTVWYDLAVAVVMGVIISGIGFAWRVATEARVESESGPDQRTFYLCGPLFFGSAMNYRKEINPLLISERSVVMDFSKCRILDISGIDAIIKTREYLMGAGKRVLLKGMPPDALPYLPKDVETADVPRMETIPEV